MGFTIHAARPDDAAALTRMGAAAFASDPLERRMLRGLETATQEQHDEYWTWRTARMVARLEKPGSHWFKAVDTETGEPIGFTGITEPENKSDAQTSSSKPPAVEVPSVLDKDLLKELEASMVAVKKQVLGDRKDYWYIPSMVVHPGYQRRGIGQALLKADTDLADADRADVYLEARAVAVKMYRSAGFEDLGVLSRVVEGQTDLVMLRKSKP